MRFNPLSYPHFHTASRQEKKKTTDLLWWSFADLPSAPSPTETSTTSKALVTRSDALVLSSFLLLLVRHLFLTNPAYVPFIGPTPWNPPSCVMARASSPMAVTRRERLVGLSFRRTPATLSYSDALSGANSATGQRNCTRLMISWDPYLEKVLESCPFAIGVSKAVEETVCQKETQTPNQVS